MAELEKTIEGKLIEQLTEGKSQWTYRLITPHQRKLEKLRQIKKSLLEKMFV